MLSLNEIRYCLIVANSSLESLAFPKIKREKYKNLQTKSVTTSPGLPYVKSSVKREGYCEYVRKERGYRKEDV